MAVIIVVGGQYGSEGKGKVCAYLAETRRARIMVRCGGPNSGHTVMVNDQPIVLRQLPAGALTTNCRLLIPSGGCVLPSLLFQEIRENNIDASRVGVDPNTVVMDDLHMITEKESDLAKRIGSTLSGTGAAVAARVNRSANVKLAKDCSELADFIVNVAEEVDKARSIDETVIIEGTQGFGLSVYHSPFYPFATSRDTTASGFASEVGISPLHIDEVVMVIRAFPIRVSGNSGPLANETTWGAVTQGAGAPVDIEEYTSVTKRLRRVGGFDAEIVRRALLANAPTAIVMNHLDYVDRTLCGKGDHDAITDRIHAFVARAEEDIGHTIDYLGTGQRTFDLVRISCRAGARQDLCQCQELDF